MNFLFSLTRGSIANRLSGRKPLRSMLEWMALAICAFGADALWGQVSGPMDVWPANSTVEIGTPKQFGAYVPITPNTITWWVNGKLGGDATCGTISPAGLYQAPAKAPVNSVLTIKAQSTAYPSSFKTTTLTVIRPYPWLWSVSPSSLQVGNYSVSFNGNNFASDSKAQANGVDLPTTYVSKTKLVATGNAVAVGTILFTVRQPGPGAVTGNSVSAPVTAVTLTVAVAPATATVQLGSPQTFTATVAGNANTAVTWSVVGGSVYGSITSGGKYTAPALMPASATVTVRATSVAIPSVFANSTVTLTQPPAVTVAVAPNVASVQVGATKSFMATVTGSPNTAVTWSVIGGPANGTISSGGVFTAPAVLPAVAVVTVQARSVANALISANATVTLLPAPVIVAVTPTSVIVQLGNTKTFVATVTGNANTAVTWSVLGGSANGTISSSGIYAPPAVMPVSPTVTVRGTAVSDPNSSADAMITLTPAVDYAGLLAASRFLEQSSFGPTPATLAAVQQLGIDGYLQQQFSLPASVIPTPPDNSVGTLQQWTLHNYTAAPDQLRQRVIYALSQIVVISANKQIYADAMLPWMNILSQQAFGNYKDLLRDVARSSSMGKFLDLANSSKPGISGGANENFPREAMQLFTIGLWRLNSDGTLLTDVNGFAIPTYDQNTVAQVALALTGWTYATAPGATPRSHNNEYHGPPMETRPENHSTVAKTILGVTVPAGQSVEQDLESVLNILMNHPNTAPFIATRLIRSLVTSNPSSGFIQRVAQVFSSSGGNLQAVVNAILTDVEARNDIPTGNSGRLKEPILHISGFLRALNGQFNIAEQLTYLYSYMAQSPLNPPSVFSWFSPLYHVPKSPLFGPEFQIYSPTEATLRGNLFHYILGNPGSDFTIDLSPFQALGNDLPGLVELVNQRLLYGRMPAGMKQVLIDAAAPGYDVKTRIETILYLTALSGQYAVQH